MITGKKNNNLWVLWRAIIPDNFASSLLTVILFKGNEEDQFFNVAQRFIPGSLR